MESQLRDVVFQTRSVLKSVAELDPRFRVHGTGNNNNDNNDNSEEGQERGERGDVGELDASLFVHRLVTKLGPYPEEKINCLIRRTCQLSAIYLRIFSKDDIDVSTPLHEFIRNDDTDSDVADAADVANTTSREDNEDDEEDENIGRRRVRRRLNEGSGGRQEQGDEWEYTTITVGQMRTLLLRLLEFCYYCRKTITTLYASRHVLRGLHRIDEEWSNVRSENMMGVLSRSSASSFSLAAGIARFSNIDMSSSNANNNNNNNEGGGGGGDEGGEGGGGKSDLNNVQQLIIYMLNVLQDEGLRRHGTDCYARITSPCGQYSTRAWKRVCSIKDIVFESTRKELNFEQWKNATKNKMNIQSVEDYLVDSVDVQFPLLVKNRHVFSFRNGVYVTNLTSVFGCPETGERGHDMMKRHLLSDAFLPFGEHDAVLPEDVVACKYFDMDFPFISSPSSSSSSPALSDIDLRLDRFKRSTDGNGNRSEAERRVEETSRADASWKNIPTPYMQSIMDYQGFESDVQEWMYALVGRLLYDLNEADAWQVVPFLKGQAGSGKSTMLLSVCRNMYDTADVGVLSNNIERKFGLSSFSDKYMFVAPEIKSDLQLEQAEFQSMISGESLQMAVKFKLARTVEWKVPGILAGNESPGWTDNSGSIGRRFVIFEFCRKVKDSDAELGRKLHAELPYIILKCNRAYHAAVRRVGHQNIWSHLPEYFLQTKDNFSEEKDPLEHFLRSEKLRFHPDAYMPFQDLKSLFLRHCEENNLGRPKLTKGLFSKKCYDFDFQIVTKKNEECRPYPRDTYGEGGGGGGGPMFPSREWVERLEPVPSRPRHVQDQDQDDGNGVFS